MEQQGFTGVVRAGGQLWEMEQQGFISVVRAAPMSPQLPVTAAITLDFTIL